MDYSFILVLAGLKQAVICDDDCLEFLANEVRILYR